MTAPGKLKAPRRAPDTDLSGAAVPESSTMSHSPQEEFLLSCDWGTSTFRLRLVRRDPVAVVEELRLDQGAQRLAAHRSSQREAAYQEVLGEARRELSRRGGRALDDVPTLISGMASSTRAVDRAQHTQARGGGSLAARTRASGTRSVRRRGSNCAERAPDLVALSAACASDTARVGGSR